MFTFLSKYMYMGFLLFFQELEAFLRNVHVSSQQLDNAESQIVRSLQLDEKASPREILRRHQYLQDSIMTTPTKILRHGKVKVYWNMFDYVRI